MQNLSVEDEITQLTESLVSFRTVKGNYTQIEECFKFIENYFDDLHVEQFEKNGDKTVLVSEEKTLEPDILLHGHIDVVEAENSLFQPEIRDRKIFGRGTSDMKAGVACLMKVMRGLVDDGSDLSVALMLTSDEERGGFNGAGYLVKEIGVEPEFAISAEPNSDEGFLDIVTHQKGVLQLRITSEGEAGHGSKIQKYENAAVKLIKSYTKIEKLFNSEDSTTLNLSHISSGDAINKVPGEAEATLDIRYTPEYPADQVLEDIRDIEEIDVEVVARAPMLENDRNNFYIQKLKDSVQSNVGEDSGRLYMKKSASDMRFFTEKGIPAVVFGPEGYNLHGDNEYAAIPSFKPYYDAVKSFCEEVAN